jgi:hypothetical protein
MKLMFFPVTMIEEFPHALLYYNFSRKKDRYFLSPFEVEISTHGSQRTVCEIIRSSDFLCGLLDIDRPTILKQIASNSSNILSVGSTTSENCPSPNNDETSSRRALSCSSTSGNTNPNDILLTMIEQKLDFKHRCMFYSTGPTTDLCGKSPIIFLLNLISYLVCALDVDYNSSVVCNAIGYSNLLTYDETVTQKTTNEEDNNIIKRTPTKLAHKMRHQHRQYIHQWICIRDIVDGLITCNHTLKIKNIMEVLSKMDRWISQRNEPKAIELKSTKSESSIMTTTNIKLFKARARQLVWDLMEMK